MLLGASGRELPCKCAKFFCSSVHRWTTAFLPHVLVSTQNRFCLTQADHGEVFSTQFVYKRSPTRQSSALRSFGLFEEFPSLLPGMSMDRIEDLHEIGAIDNAKFDVPGVASRADSGCALQS